MKFPGRVDLYLLAERLTNLLGISPFEFIAKLLVLFTAMPVHEYSHAAMAVRLGDETPLRQGRLTLNPFVHLSALGSIALIFLGFGWANPVMIDTRNFKRPKRDMALTSIAGPISNIFMAFLALVGVKLIIGLNPSIRETSAAYVFLVMLSYMMQINLWLAVFNLLPVPPLDGSKILAVLLPNRVYNSLLRYERVLSIILVVLLISGILYVPLYWLSDSVSAMLDFITRPIDWLTGMLRG